MTEAAWRALDRAVGDFRRAEQLWLAAEMAKAELGSTWQEREAAKRQVRVRLKALRAEGKLLGTKELLVAAGLRLALEARGWDREWDPVPDGARDRGRPLGDYRAKHDESHEEGETEYPRLVNARLPIALAQRAVRSTYWTSAEWVARIREWDSQWLAEDSPPVPLEAWADRRRFQMRVVTVGDLMREAVGQAVSEVPRSIPGMIATVTPLEAAREAKGDDVPAGG
ncbi:hypothetical protein EDD38_7663 [Kitasatospora cineracea]|uniref:Uncharacterized protein n=1 Tax=Kitasatospora cineracea TaxID=88074 RepID=A0A3N4R0F5_9ACTN|nr:hypothetical protein EDD38_7663 [Kitasatospora cineracea]